MSRYVSLLRGINVSGQKKILMKDLKALYETLGFINVVSYIQSGNVVFECEQNTPNDFAKKINQAIQQHYGFDVPICIRNRLQIQAIINNCPFEANVLENEANKVMVFYLSDTPSQKHQQTLLNFVKPPEQLTIQDTTLYLYSPNGFGKSKLSNNFVEKKLNVQSTARNWKTTLKLLELLN